MYETISEPNLWFNHNHHNCEQMWVEIPTDL